MWLKESLFVFDPSKTMFGENELLVFWLTEDADSLVLHGEITTETAAAASKAEGVWAKIARDIANAIDRNGVPPGLRDGIRDAHITKQGQVVSLSMSLKRADLVQMIHDLLSKQNLGSRWPVAKPGTN